MAIKRIFRISFKEFQSYLEKIIDENNGIKITKDCGLFICRK